MDALEGEEMRSWLSEEAWREEDDEDDEDKEDGEWAWAVLWAGPNEPLILRLRSRIFLVILSEEFEVESSVELVAGVSTNTEIGVESPDGEEELAIMRYGNVRLVCVEES